MEVQSSMLTRNPCSLVRSHDRSSAYCLSSIDETLFDPEENKPHSRPPSFSAATSCFPAIQRTLISCFRLVFFTFLLLLLLIFIFIALLFLFLYLRNEGSIWNLCLVSMAAAAVSIVLKKSGLFCFRRRRESVQWFIGDVENPKPNLENKFVKEGAEFYRNGDFYEGEFHLGKCNGSGVYEFFKQGRYEGDWINGKYDGYGIERSAMGNRYHGQYQKGLRHGFGVYKLYNGDDYSGEWFYGQSHGRGVQRCSDGSFYVGEFKFGVKHGLGFYQFRNSDRYTGEYFGGKIHGFGVYHFANGHCYEGSWHEGTQQGFGTYTFRMDDAKSGEWDCGTLKNALPPSHPHVQRSVQCGRNAAESAILLPLVEEQVNHAVTAANRAATAARVAAIRAVSDGWMVLRH